MLPDVKGFEPQPCEASAFSFHNVSRGHLSEHDACIVIKIEARQKFSEANLDGRDFRRIIYFNQ